MKSQLTAQAPPVTARGWLALFTAFAVVTLAFGPALFCWPAFYRPLSRAFGWNFASANAGGAIILVLIGFLSPVVGALVDRFGAKAVILGGIATVAAAFLLLSTIHSLEQYYAYCVLLGCGISAVSIVPASLLAGPYFARGRGLVIGAINAGSGLGGFLAPRFTASQILQHGIPAAFLTLAASMAIPFMITLLVLKGETRETRPRAAVAQPSLPAARLIRLPMFWLFGTALFLCAHGMLGVQQNLITYLTGAHVSVRDAALVLSIVLAAAAPGKLLAGIVADRNTARLGVIASSLFIVAGIAALLNTRPQSGWIYGVAVIFGIGYGGIFNAVPTIVFEHFGTHRVGRSVGLFYMFFGLGAGSGGELAGHLFDRTHRWDISFMVDLAFACLGLLLLLATGKQTRSRALENLPPTVIP